jgi:hypothetical protein
MIWYSQTHYLTHFSRQHPKSPVDGFVHRGSGWVLKKRQISPRLAWPDLISLCFLAQQVASILYLNTKMTNKLSSPFLHSSIAWSDPYRKNEWHWGFLRASGARSTTEGFHCLFIVFKFLFPTRSQKIYSLDRLSFLRFMTKRLRLRGGQKSQNHILLAEKFAVGKTCCVTVTYPSVRSCTHLSRSWWEFFLTGSPRPWQ